MTPDTAAWLIIVGVPSVAIGFAALMWSAWRRHQAVEAERHRQLQRQAEAERAYVASLPVEQQTVYLLQCQLELQRLTAEQQRRQAVAIAALIAWGNVQDHNRRQD